MTLLLVICFASLVYSFFLLIYESYVYSFTIIFQGIFNMYSILLLLKLLSVKGIELTSELLPSPMTLN